MLLYQVVQNHSLKAHWYLHTEVCPKLPHFSHYTLYQALIVRLLFQIWFFPTPKFSFIFPAHDSFRYSKKSIPHYRIISQDRIFLYILLSNRMRSWLGNDRWSINSKVVKNNRLSLNSRLFKCRDHSSFE